jgi:hypothetical protein
VSRKLQLVLFAAGSAVFAYLVSRIGVGRLVADARQTGWMFVPILLLYGVVYLGNAWAWWLTMADEPSRPPFWRAYAITVSGFSLNFMTPMVNVGGEPFKIAAVAPWRNDHRGHTVLVALQETDEALIVLATVLVAPDAIERGIRLESHRRADRRLGRYRQAGGGQQGCADGTGT